MKIRRAALVFAVLVALGAVVAVAAGYTRTIHIDVADNLGRLIDDPSVQERLSLTSDQTARLRTIRDQARTSIRELRATAIRARADLRATVLDTKAARKDIERSAAALREARSAVSQELTKALLDARDVLSAEQREELRSIVVERSRTLRRGFRHGRRGRGPLDGDGGSGHDADSDDGTDEF